MPDFHDILALDQIPEGSCAVVTIEDREIAITRSGNDVHAIDNECPHKGASLSDGYIDGDRIVCPLHQWEFELTTGACLEEPSCPVVRHETRVENDRVHIKINTTTSA